MGNNKRHRNARETHGKLDTILIFSGEEGVVIWAVGGLVFEEAEGGLDEFVEDGDEDGHLSFAGGGEAVGERFETGVVAAGDHGDCRFSKAEIEVRKWS